MRVTPLAYDRTWERLLYKSKLEADTKFFEIIETPRKILMIGLASRSWATVMERLPGL